MWSNKKQPTFALSSTEAEYRGAVVAMCKAIWLKRLLKEVEVFDPTTIYCNNLSNIQLAKNPVFRAYVCEACQLGKHNRLPFPNELNRSQNPLDVIHLDV